MKTCQLRIKASSSRRVFLAMTWILEPISLRLQKSTPMVTAVKSLWDPNLMTEQSEDSSSVMLERVPSRRSCTQTKDSLLSCLNDTALELLKYPTQIIRRALWRVRNTDGRWYAIHMPHDRTASRRSHDRRVGAFKAHCSKATSRYI